MRIKTDTLKQYIELLQSGKDHDLQEQVLDKLAVDGSPGAVAVLAETLLYPGFPLKSQSLTLLININQLDVYRDLLLVMKNASPEIMEELRGLARRFRLTDVLLDRLERWQTAPDFFPAVAAILSVLGYVGGHSVVAPVSQCLFHHDDEVKQAAIGCLETLTLPECVSYLYAPLKLSSDTMALNILDLMARFHDRRSIIPLLGTLGATTSVVKERIIQVLAGYDSTVVEKEIDGHLDGTDRSLCRAALMFYERSGHLAEARKLRTRFQMEDRLGDAQQTGPAAELGVEVKLVGDIAVIALAGILDMYSLPTLTGVLETLVYNGRFKLLIMCEQVESIDRESLKSINRLAENLEAFGGTLKMVALDAADISTKHELLPRVHEYPTIRESIRSFETGDLARMIRFNEEMVPPGKWVELNVHTGSRSWSRRTRVIRHDGGSPVLEWHSSDPEDVFREVLSTGVELIVVYRNVVLCFETRVEEQQFYPNPHVVLAPPRMGRAVGQRQHVRVPSSMPVVFHLQEGTSHLRKNLRGTCRNVSAGGLLISSGEALPMHGIIALKFEEDRDLGTHGIVGKIVSRGRSCAAGDGGGIEYGIQFLNIPGDTRLAIGRLVFRTISEDHSKTV